MHHKFGRLVILGGPETTSSNPITLTVAKIAKLVEINERGRKIFLTPPLQHKWLLLRVTNANGPLP